MREIKPSETQRLPAQAAQANAQESVSVTLASANPHAEPRRHAERTLHRDGEPHFRAALDAGTRAGSSSSELQKTIADLHRNVTRATDVNSELGRELGALSALLESAGAQQQALAERVAQLEAELSTAERERQLVTAQQDQFIAALLDEHEAARRARDEALVTASKYERERDEIRAEASQLRASLGVQRPSTSPPPPTAVGRAPSFLPAPPLRLDENELDATLYPRSPTPVPPPTASQFPRERTRPGVGGPKPSFGPKPGWTPPPPAPDTAVTRSPWPVSAATLPPEATPTLPILKRKPDPTTRPLIDYSLGEGGVQSETLEGAKLRSSKPPRK